MARVPLYQPGSVPRQGKTDAKFEAADFRTSVMGEGLQRAGAALSDYVEKKDQIEAFHDNIDAQKLDLEHVEQTRILQDQLRQARGVGAAAEATRLEGELATYNRDLLARARSDRSRLALRDSIGRRTIGEVERYHAYADQETEQDYRATSDARVTSLTEQARDIEDETLAATAFAQVPAAIADRARFEGWEGGANGPVAQAALLRQSTQFYIGRAQALARAGNPQAAIDYAQAHAEQITGDQLDAFVGGLTNEADEQWAAEDYIPRMLAGGSSAPQAGTAAPARGAAPSRTSTNAAALPDPPGHFAIPGGFNIHDGFRRNARGNDGSGTHVGMDAMAREGTPFPIGRPFEVLPGSHRQAVVRNGRDGGNIATIRVEGAGTWKAMHLPDLPAAGRYAAGAPVIRAGRSGFRPGSTTEPHVHWQPVDDQARAIYSQGRRAVVAALTGGAVVASASGGGGQQQAGEDALQSQLAAVRADTSLTYGRRQAVERVLRRQHAEVMQAREERESEAGRQADQWAADHIDSFTSTSQVPGYTSLSPSRQVQFAERARANRDGGRAVTPEQILDYNFTRYSNPERFASRDYYQHLISTGANQSLLRQWAADAGQMAGTTANQRAQNVTDQRLWSIADPILREIGLDFDRVNEASARGSNGRALSNQERQADARRKNQILTRLREYSQIWTQAHPGQVPDDALMRGWVGNLVLNANGQRLYEADDQTLFVEIMRSTLGPQISANLARRGAPVTPQNVVAAYRRFTALQTAPRR